MDKIFAKKSLGQNFLINPGIVEKIITAGNLEKDDTVIEIGPGTGVLTKILAQKAGRVIAIEKDHRLVEDLKKDFPDIEVIAADVLEFDARAHDLKPNCYKVIGNLPYYITSHFLKLLLSAWPVPSLAVLMVQKEVAQRIIAKPPQMSVLAIAVQLYMAPEIIISVSAGSFRPIPKVDSAVIRLTPRREPVANPEKILQIAKRGFAQKRKKLISNLAEFANTHRLEALFKEIGLAPTVRAERLTLDQWILLSGKL